MDELHSVITEGWDNEYIPDDWKTSIIVPIFKNGDRMDCKNYRGLSLIPIAAKLFAVILLNRFRNTRYSRTRPNQAGFRPGMGCYDQIFSLRQILEHRFKHQQETIQIFIDFITAFDSVHRDAICEAMREDSVPEKIINLLKAYYAGTKARVRVDGDLSDLVLIEEGVRQGCVLSPYLFNFVIDWILRVLDKYKGVAVSPSFSVTDLDYADDVDMLAESVAEAQAMINDMAVKELSTGLQISLPKTKSMQTEWMDETPVALNGNQIEDVQSFKYLASMVNPAGESSEEIQSRISSAWSVFLQLRKYLWKRSELSLRTKLRVYEAMVLSVLLYGCEKWSLKAAEALSLNIFNHKCLRYILGIRLSDRISNEEVRRRCGDRPLVSDIVKHRRLRWFGHTMRRPDDHISKKCLKCLPLPAWKKRAGGQKKTWLATVKSDLEPIGGFRKYSRRMDRQWLELVEPATLEQNLWKETCRHLLGATMSLDAP